MHQPEWNIYKIKNTQAKMHKMRFTNQDIYKLKYIKIEIQIRRNKDKLSYIYG